MKTTTQERTFVINTSSKKKLIKDLNLKSAYEFDKIVKPNKEKLGLRLGRLYTPKQVKIIYELVQEYRKSK